MNSFNRPGGNFTGATMMSYEINGKRLELLREMFPKVTHVGVLSNPMHPGEYGELKVTEATAEKLGLKLSYGRIVSAADVELAFNLVRSKGADAINVLPDGGMMQHREKFAALAAQQRIPVISGWQEFARAGGVMSYGPNVAKTYRRIASYVDKILRGSHPSELPVEQPTQFELVVKSQGGQGPRPDRAADAARPRRRGDRISGRRQAKLAQFSRCKSGAGRPSKPPGSECCVRRRRRRTRSVHSGCVGCVIEPRNDEIAGAEAVTYGRTQHVQCRYARHCRPAGVEAHITRKWIVSEPGISRVPPPVVRVGGPHREGEEP